MRTPPGIIISLLLLAPSPLYSKGAPPKTIQQQTINGGLPAVAPDGKHIAFSSNRNGSADLYVITADGSKETQLTNTPEHESFSSWTADSRQVNFSVLKDGTSSIYTINLSGKNQRLITTVPGRSPVLSPDGKQLIYATGSWTKMALVLTGVHGGSTSQLNDGESIAWNIHWSNDGKRFAFTGKNDPKSELAVFVANADGTDKRQVSQVPPEEGGAQWPVWSKDGRKLAVQVASRKQKSSHIWLVDMASGESNKLASHSEAYLDETPSWFPDQKRIAFQSNRTGRMEVWVMNVDGTNPRQLTH